ncbi:MAG: hypothetical protein E7301_00675 [Butyrivibrio sp.]|nr:hypothetical protein [Butyrivibrio sp.]
MKNRILKMSLSITTIAALSVAMLSGCASSKVAETVPETEVTEKTETTESSDAETVIESAATETESTEAENAEAATDTTDQEVLPEAPYFVKGVYSCYNAADENPEKTFFYVFYDETSGRYENAVDGMGLPFTCEQKDEKVILTLGGEGEEPKDVLEVSSVENGIVKASYEESDSVLVFEPIPDADPDNFDSAEYMVLPSESE